MQTRKERASKARQGFVAEYSDVARQVLEGLLEKYADEGPSVLEQAADRRQAQQLLKVEPFKKYGSPVQIARAFGGRERFFTAVRELSKQIYTS